MREFLRGLELDPETIDSIMAEFGKSVTKDKEEIQELKGQVSELLQSSDVEWKRKFEELDNQIKDQEAKKHAEDEDKKLTNNIMEVFGNKQFTSDYARNGFISDIKKEMVKPENQGKGIKDLALAVSNGKEGIFTNPNEILDLPGTNEDVDGMITKDKFEKMSYAERLELKQSNPDLFKKLNV